MPSICLAGKALADPGFLKRGGGVTNVDCSPKSEVCYILTHSDHSINNWGHALPSTIGSEN